MLTSFPIGASGSSGVDGGTVVLGGALEPEDPDEPLAELGPEPATGVGSPLHTLVEGASW